MMIEFKVQIGERTHRILIAVPADSQANELREFHQFAVNTALLEHLGYLPAGAINAVA